MSELIRAGIFGPTLCGKTKLAKWRALDLWRREKRLAIVLDPNRENWGPHAFVTDNFEKFDRLVWHPKFMRQTIIMDEGTETINRDREMTKYFTRIRHQLHHFFIMGHDGTTLLPIMRAQLSEVCLFRQNQNAAQLWADQFCEPALLGATGLAQYEFIRFQSFQTAERGRLTASEVASVP